jgi:hypothetical protein
MFSHMTEAQQDLVVGAVREASRPAVQKLGPAA